MKNSEILKLQEEIERLENLNEELSKEILAKKESFIESDTECLELINEAMKLKVKRDKAINSIALKLNPIDTRLHNIQQILHQKQKDLVASSPELTAKTKEMLDAKKKALELTSSVAQALKEYVNSGDNNV